MVSLFRVENYPEYCEWCYHEFQHQSDVSRNTPLFWHFSQYSDMLHSINYFVNGYHFKCLQKIQVLI